MGFTTQVDTSSKLYNPSLKPSDYLSASDERLNIITSVTPGEATTGKALLINSDQDITQFRNIGFTGDLTLNGFLVTQTDLANLKQFMANSFPGFAPPNAILISDSNSDMNGIRQLTTTGTMRITGSTPALTGGSSLEIEYDQVSSVANIRAIDRSTSAYKVLSLNDCLQVGSVVTCQRHITTSSGLHAYGSGSSGLSGAGAHMQYSGSAAQFIGYNHTSSSYTDMSLGNSRIFIKGANGYVGIGTTTPSYPLLVDAGVTSNTSWSSFGYVDSSGSGRGASYTNRPLGAFFASNVLIGPGSELNVTSDGRLKRSVQPISDDTLERFLSIRPVEYQFNHQAEDDPHKHHGYIAQELIWKQLHDFVSISHSDERLEEQDIECDDGSLAHLGADCRLTVSLQNMIPLLHAALRKQHDRIQKNEQLIAELLETIGMHVTK